MQPSCWRGSTVEGSSAHLDGGYESTCDVGAEQRGHVQLAHVLLLSQGAGDALLAQELQAGHPVLHAHHVQRRAARQEQAGVSVAPADGSDGPLKQQFGTVVSSVVPLVSATGTGHVTCDSSFLSISFIFSHRDNKANFVGDKYSIDLLCRLHFQISVTCGSRFLR